jgi:hypothetical protein
MAGPPAKSHLISIRCLRPRTLHKMPLIYLANSLEAQHHITWQQEASEQQSYMQLLSGGMALPAGKPHTKKTKGLG